MSEATESAGTGTEEIQIDLFPEGTAPQAEPAQDPVEAEAAKFGWRPKEQYDGPAGGFIDAKEFLQRAPLFDKIKSQSKELKQLKKSMDAITSQFQTQVKAQVQLRLTELKAAKREAIEAQDVDRVEAIDQEIAQTSQQSKVDLPQIPSEVSDWVSENPWFDTNPELRTWATTHNKLYVQNNPQVGLEDSLSATRKAIEKAFPDFDFKKNQPKAAAPTKPPSPVEMGGDGKSGARKGYTVGRLNESQKEVYRQLVQRDKILSHEEYFKGLDEIGELQ